MFTADNTATFLDSFNQKVINHKSYLNDLDQAIGDGDHGSNMARGTEAMMSNLKETNQQNVSDMFKDAAMALIKTVGGASGPLYGTAFMEISKEAQASDASLSELLRAGLAGIEKRGKASQGDKTMLDVWIAVTEAIETQTLTHQIIQDAVEETKHLQASKGRASFFGERTIGYIDPGAASSGLLFEALLESGVYNG